MKKKPQNPPEAVQKSASWDEKIERYHRFGTPITRRGTVNGFTPTLKPGMPASLNRPVIVKALAPTAQPTPGAAGTQYGRKRDEHGRFSDNQSTGSQSAADEDLAEASREQRQAQAKLGVREGKEYQQQEQRVTKNLALGASPLDQQGAADMNNMQGQPIGATKSGQPMFDDPFHPNHSKFGPQDHNDAAEAREQLAAGASGMGAHAEAMKHTQAAQAHRDMANDAMSPMDRKMEAAPPGGAPFQRGLDDGSPKGGFLDQSRRDQNKPQMPPGSHPGPQPGMIHSATQQPVGPQTQQSAMHAGTTQQRQPEPSAFSYPGKNPNQPPMGQPGMPPAQPPAPPMAQPSMMQQKPPMPPGPGMQPPMPPAGPQMMSQNAPPMMPPAPPLGVHGQPSAMGTQPPPQAAPAPAMQGTDALRKLQGMATETEDPEQGQDMKPPMAPNRTVGDSIESAEEHKNHAPAFKSLAAWRTNRK